MNQKTYLELISGKATGPIAPRRRVARVFLRVAALPYRVIVNLRNILYDRRWLKIHNVNALVISVGNITVGGTGKTPLVIWLCNVLAKKGFRCAVLTRGYKATQNSKLITQNCGDEVAVITESCCEAKVIVNPDRVAGANEALKKYGAQVLVLDDGFQHRRLARDVDIVTIDATRPFGYGRLLPAGVLREPVAGLRRADGIVITRCDQVDEERLNKIEDELHRLSPDAVISRSIHAPAYVCFADTRHNPAELTGRRVFAFCGIGNPDAFLGTIKQQGACLTGSMVFNDHHHYTQQCLEQICEQAENHRAEMILTTEKDWTKIAPLRTEQPNAPLAYLAVQMKFIGGEAALIRLIEASLRGRIRPVTNKKTDSNTPIR